MYQGSITFFWLSAGDPSVLLVDKKFCGFDEWGRCGQAMKAKGWKHRHSSMDGIINQHMEDLELRTDGRLTSNTDKIPNTCWIERNPYKRIRLYYRQSDGSVDRELTLLHIYSHKKSLNQWLEDNPSVSEAIFNNRSQSYVLRLSSREADPMTATIVLI